MVTREQFSELALSLPEATAGSHFAQPDFRVRGKIFCSLDRAGERCALKVRKDVQALLVGSRPEAFVPATGAWGDSGWTHVELPHVAIDELRELVTDAWLQVAPKRLATQHASALQAAAQLVIVVSPAPARPATEKRPRRATKAARKKAPRRRRDGSTARRRV